MNYWKKRKLRKLFTRFAMWSLVLLPSLHFTSCNFAYRFFLYVEEGSKSYPCLGIYEFEIIIYDLDESGNRIDNSNYITTLQLGEDNNLAYSFWNRDGLCDLSIPIKGIEYGGYKQLEIIGRDSTGKIISQGRSPSIKVDRNAEVTDFYVPLYRNCSKFPKYNNNPDDEANTICKNIVVKNALTLLILIKRKNARETYDRFEIVLDGEKYTVQNKDKSGVIVLTNLDRKTGSYIIRGVSGSIKDNLGSGKYSFAQLKPLIRYKGSQYHWGVEQIEIR